MFKYETDSRKVTNGQIFVAIKGITTDGHDYINEAINNGARMVVSEKELDIDIPYIKVDNTYEYLKNILSKEYGNEIKKMNLIGITGTNGKTTSSYLTYQMLNLLGVNTAYIGTIGYYYKDEFIPLNNTTPDLLTIYKLLIKAKENNCKVVVMEVSSHALVLDRLHDINFSKIAFTNLTEDHLDFHKTMDDYLKAKLLILDYLKDNANIIVNSDDENYLSFKKDGYDFCTIGLNGNYKILNYNFLPNETDLSFSFNNKKYNVTIPLTNMFNIYNYLTMLSIVNKYGFEIEDIIKYTKDLKAPKGRCEVHKLNKGYAVIDYAHTPDAVLKVIEAYNEIKKGKVITIIGCGGNRDSKKRPIMGDIATKLSDYVIFTNDNPRMEDPVIIMNDILSGVNSNNYEVIFDRKDAIKAGLQMLNNDDILLILGKGHEDYQIIGKTKYHLDDVEEVLSYMKSNE